ncbi:MAG: KUP/HAK/KT family potassium transporter [Candidatus Riflebacteria bacterium]|nr:KUP/HAK/KT family potassium transporter [Candidatus Riflebacteria bacterium]
MSTTPNFSTNSDATPNAVPPLPPLTSQNNSTPPSTVSQSTAQTSAFITPPGSFHSPDSSNLPTKELFTLAIGALGVVFGDIGTSPLYTVKECFSPTLGLPPTTENIFGIISLIFWSLSLVVVFKYIIFVMKADNNGEGGIMALVALLKEKGKSTQKLSDWIIGLAIFGTSLLLADGMITPAISVLSAMEGLDIATPVFKPFIVPMTLCILVVLFLVQYRGTGAVAKIFGPLMAIWFVTIGFLGCFWIVKKPSILYAINPWYAFDHFSRHGWSGFMILGAVILCVTGAEAFYADMGHFGRKPINIAWFYFAYPALFLNYFGQGAVLLIKGEVVRENPFYGLCPLYLHIPLVLISTTATIIASQALISGAYSLAQQAMQLGYTPRLTIRHTSSRASGQIYIPEVNTSLMIACCGLVIGFRESGNLAAAYGIAVMGTMTITSVLLFKVMREIWNWSLPKAMLLTSIFLSIDLPFLFANMGKVFYGGWVPLLIGSLCFVFMTTWHRGRKALYTELQKAFLPLDKFLAEIALSKIYRVKGTAVFMTSNSDTVPQVLLHHYKHNKVLHERVVFLVVLSEHVPEVSIENRVEVRNLGNGFHQIIGRYGFMETPNVPDLLECATKKSFPFKMMETSFFLGRESLLLSGKSDMYHWRKWFFRLISRNAREATAFFGIPPNRVLELGTQIEL